MKRARYRFDYTVLLGDGQEIVLHSMVEFMRKTVELKQAGVKYRLRPAAVVDTHKEVEMRDRKAVAS